MISFSTTSPTPSIYKKDSKIKTTSNSYAISINVVNNSKLMALKKMSGLLNQENSPIEEMA
jgi:hypothetical protein